MTTNQTIDGVPREFVREGRYIVVKPDYEDDIRTERLRNYIEEMCFHTPDCVVVEADWPEYEPVWRMIEARVIGNPTELDAAKATISQLQGLVAELRALLDAPAENMIDVSATDWAAIQEAASESTWMPSEYMRNDWVEDVCRFLREGPAAQPQGEPVSMALKYLARVLDEDQFNTAEDMLYAEQPAPVADPLAKGFTTLESDSGKYKIVTSFATRDDAWSAYRALLGAKPASVAVQLLERFADYAESGKVAEPSMAEALRSYLNTK